MNRHEARGIRVLFSLMSAYAGQSSRMKIWGEHRTGRSAGGSIRAITHRIGCACGRSGRRPISAGR